MFNCFDVSNNEDFTTRTSKRYKWTRRRCLLLPRSLSTKGPASHDWRRLLRNYTKPSKPEGIEVRTA